MPPQRCTIPAMLAAVATLLCPYGSCADADVENASADPVFAIWRIHRVDFVYHSPTVYYSCSALQAKIGAILRAVGAHTRVVVDVGCMGGNFVNHAFARVTLAVPAEATQETIHAATTFDTRERLIARVRKIQLPTSADIARFPAEWQTVSLSHRRGLHFGPGDCDLLRAMRKQVFPQLSIRIGKGGLRCTSGIATRLRPQLEVTALMPAPAPPLTAGTG